MMDKIYKLSAKIKLRTKLFLLFFALLMITLALSSYGYYNYSLDNAVNQYSRDTYQSIRQSTTILDLKLLKIVENSELMIKDKEIYRIFDQINPQDPYELLKYDRELKRVIAKYFDYNEQVYSQTLMTSYYTFGEGFIPYDKFQTSELYRHISEGEGKLVWEPTYDFIQMYDEEDLADYNIDEFRYLFTSGRILNVFDNSTGEITYLPKNKERPVLLINFKEDFLKVFFDNLLVNDNKMIFLAAPNGRIVSANSEQSRKLALQSDWLQKALTTQSGTLHVDEQNGPMIVSYDTSQITGWTLVSVIQNKDLIPQVSRNIRNTIVELGTLVLAVSLILAYLMSMLISKPISKLISAIQKTGRGNFANKIPVQGYSELDMLIRRFNDMNDKIQQLIHENFEVKLLENQAQINVLNTQLNPHFLYNTLNLVSCIAIENRNSEISQIVTSLSRMLHYTVENNKSVGKLQEELTWLDGYIYIMCCRFEDRLEYGCYVEPALLNGDVPRLFLQPFVENAFIHGFEEMEHGCVLRISGWMEDGRRYFTVRDNGKGMSQERMEKVMSGEGSSVGMRNVHNRLKLMYGEEYGITLQSSPGNGTTIVICMPEQTGHLS
jgi:two-component system sensor histidine kinase YesM